MIWILYARFNAHRHSVPLRQQKRIAGVFYQVCSDIKARVQNTPVRIDEITSKKEFLECIGEIQKKNTPVSEWHFVGCGTPYGPLLGCTEWPDVISAYEWVQLQIPFATHAKAWFYMEDSAGWFAPFISTSFKVKTYGCHRLTKINLSDMPSFPPGIWTDTADYNPIASLYAEAFSDITVRRDECRWIEEKLLQLKPDKVLDIGCGNGALLAHLSPKIKWGIGVDISREAITLAAQNNRHRANLSFTVIEGPSLPFADHSINTIVSLLSFRYLDWDTILEEMKRIIAPGGHILIVDMLAVSPRFYEWPLLVTDKLKNFMYLRNRQHFLQALRRLVAHPAWRKMIDRHPMHLQDEFVWYLKSRFPNGEVKVLNRGVKANILSFDSGPIS